MISFLLLILGIVLLLAGGSALVRGASDIAKDFNVSSLIIGLTVVAFGTSTPELVVNVTGALRGETDLAFGNAVGSNLANFGLVLGAAALFSPIFLKGQLVRREVPFLLLITAILMVMAWDAPLSGRPGVLDRGDAIVLLLLFSIFMYFTIRDVVTAKEDPVVIDAADKEGRRASKGLLFNLVLCVIGFALLTYGGSLTITSGAEIAEFMGVPEVVVGIFIVAVGTSLPELITSVIAAFKQETDLALGNIVGSNIFNSLIVLPAAGIIRPLPVPSGGDVDLVMGFAFVLVLIPLFFFSGARLGRGAGAALLLAYFAYLAYRFT